MVRISWHDGIHSSTFVNQCHEATCSVKNSIAKFLMQFMCFIRSVGGSILLRIRNDFTIHSSVSEARVYNIATAFAFAKTYRLNDELYIFWDFVIINRSVCYYVH